MVSLLSLLKHAGRAPELIAAKRQTPAWPALLKYYLELGQPQYPLQLPLRGGGLLTLSDSSEVKVFWNLFIHGAYAIPVDCETILDCGANAGIFCLWAVRQRLGVRIVALEPFPPTFAELEANVRQNHLEDQIQCVQVGLAAVAGDRSMFAAGDSPLRGLVPSDLQAPPETIPVRCVRLADCLQDLRMEKLDLLKMDIEGSEWEVLLSTEPSVLSRIRHIQIEYHEAPARFGYTPEKLFAHLMEAGHKLTFRFEDACRTGLAHFERVTN
jgi:FkbM family methyltransferase